MALSAMQRSVSRVLQCSRWQKRGIMMITDALILPLLLWGAYALRFSTLQPVVHDTWLFPIAALTSVATASGRMSGVMPCPRLKT